jgi:hypothetical protein
MRTAVTKACMNALQQTFKQDVYHPPPQQIELSHSATGMSSHDARGMSSSDALCNENVL